MIGPGAAMSSLGVAFVTVQEAAERREALKERFLAAKSCELCPQLAQARTHVVFGSGNADADLMFVGEAPGQNEDEQAMPFVGRAGKLLDELLAEIGMTRADVFVTNVLMCRPPDNRDPQPSEVERCQQWLWEKLELVRPTVVCTLGNLATKLLRADQTGITKIRGQVEERQLGSMNVRLLPLFHPAAALYTPSNVELLRGDFQQIPALLELPPLDQPVVRAPEPEPEIEPEPDAESFRRPAADPQLGLF